MIIIVGLGNEGSLYQNTYHNLGFMTVDRLAKRIGIEFTKKKYKSTIALGKINGQSVMLAKPSTFMNNSGQAVVMMKEKYKDARIIVVVDDIDLEKGKIRYRQHGHSGTHNGLRSITSFIGNEFERVRIGIGRDESKDLADFVLSKIDKNDLPLFDKAIDEACDLIMEKIS